MKTYLTTLIVIMLIGCNSDTTPLNTTQNIIRDTIILHDTVFYPFINDSIRVSDSLNYSNQGIVFIKYRTPVNNYNIDAVWHPIVTSDYILDGPAILRFKKKGEECITILHESFFPSESFMSRIKQDTLKLKHSFIIDYEEGTRNKDSHDVFKEHAPFFFADVNFDGEKDLVLNLRRKGQRFSNMYRVYLYEDYYCHYNNDILYRATEKLPFSRFDDLTRFDSDKKEIILYNHGGVSHWTEEYYRMDEYNVFQLYKIVEQDNDTIYEYQYIKRKKSQKLITK